MIQRTPPPITLLLGLCCAVLFTTVEADDISYTYLDGQIQSSNPEFGSSETGYRLEGSLGLPLNLYAIAVWEDADTSSAGDLSAADLGLGWHLGLGDTVHGLAELKWSNREAGLFDEDGYSASLGVRIAPGERWEFGVKAGYRDLEDNLSGGYGEAYVLWKVWGVLGLTARAELAEDSDTVGVGARVSF